MRVTIHDVQRMYAKWHSDGATHWVNVDIIDGGFGTRETETELVLFFPCAPDAFRFANAINASRRPAPNFVVIEPAPEPAA